VSILVDFLHPPLLVADYHPLDGVYDEMATATGAFRPHWEGYVTALSELGAEELARRWRTARQRIHENGVTYNVYADPLGMDRPWSLDAIPLLISPSEWSRIEAGLIQRAQLLNWILADLYGPQELLLGGHLPAGLIFANPGFWRPCHGIRVPGNTYVHLLAVDLARSPDGEWWVLSDRTQAPSGAGYALENRIVLAETFNDLYRDFRVRRLASFFRALRDNLLALAQYRGENPRVVVLTPGSLNETYFEHSYLARYLGFTLAQGGDLTVRDSRVFLKTLEGLKKVDVILRRLDDGFCDPIELRSDSFLGVAGLVEAARAGNVLVANALGSGLIETSSLMPFLPGLSERFLGEKLKLRSVATWWCGQPAALRYVRDNLDFLCIKPAFPSKGMEPVFGGQLWGDQRTRLIRRLEARPFDFTGQELLSLSTAPVWSDDSFVPRRVVLRAYVAAAGDSWVVMPGGLARVSPSLETQVVSMQRGGGSKDAWVLSDRPVDNFTLQRSPDLPVEINRGAQIGLQSRAADFLYWLGRYAERSENLARILRSILLRITGESGAAGPVEWRLLLKLHDCLDSTYSRMTDDDPQGHLDLARDFEQEILSLIFEEQRPDSLYVNLNRASRAAAQVRDRLSSDLLRIISQLGSLARADGSSSWGYVSPGDALAVLNHTIATLACIRGIEMDNITRQPGWHFLSMGRRIERSLQLIRLFRSIIVPLRADTWPMLEMLLEVGDSSMTYRSRYFTVLQPAPVLDLLMNDELNPRSLAFQLRELVGHCRALATVGPGAPSSAGWPLAHQKRVEEVGASLFEVEAQLLCQPSDGGHRAPLDDMLARLEFALLAFSDAITRTYFSHAQMETPA
jgi:uncharacterized circularly permuted ATP-grasp superfamily protein/uncharacterized alpha-E superfamily protein